MEFRILGPMEVTEHGQTVPLGGAKQRALLAVLLLHPNEVVSSDRLIDGVWAGEPPATALKRWMRQSVKFETNRHTRQAAHHDVPDIEPASLTCVSD